VRLNIIAVFVAVAAGGATAQTCNPAIDGTYCATQMQRGPRQSPGPAARTMPGMQFGSTFSTARDQPGTLGAITFNGDGSRCLGLLRRFSCN